MLDKLIEPALKVYDRISEGEEYSDIEREQARKGKSYLSNALNLLMAALLIFMCLSIWLLWSRPSKSVCDDRVEQKNEVIESQNTEIQRLNRKLEKYENYLLPKMDELEPKLDEIEKKAEKNESHFDKLLNKAENAVNK